MLLGYRRSIRTLAPGAARAAAVLVFAGCSRTHIPEVVSTVVSPDGRDRVVIARNPQGVLDETGAPRCVYDEYVGTASSDPTHIASYQLPCDEPPPRAVWRAYNPDGHSFDVHLIDASGHELGAESRTWHLPMPF